MSWADDGPSESNHVPGPDLFDMPSVPTFFPRHGADSSLAELEYRALCALWEQFKEAYDRADEDLQLRLRSEWECFL